MDNRLAAVSLIFSTVSILSAAGMITCAVMNENAFAPPVIVFAVCAAVSAALSLAFSKLARLKVRKRREERIFAILNNEENKDNV